MFHSTISSLQQKIPVSDDVIACDLRFGPPPQSKILATPTPGKTLGRNYLNPKVHSLNVHLAETTLPEITSARRLIWQKIHLPVITFP